MKTEITGFVEFLKTFYGVELTDVQIENLKQYLSKEENVKRVWSRRRQDFVGDLLEDMD